jgi:predicted phage terminase large subunit-like protein
MAAGQLQQRPTAREGGLFKREWFANPAHSIPHPDCLQLVRAWDFASTAEQKNDPDYTVGVLMGRDPSNKMIYVIDVVRGRWSPAQREKNVQWIADQDGSKVRIRIPKDPGSAGKFEAHHFAGLLQGYRVQTESERGSKENRADLFAAQCEHGYVKLLQRDWNKAFIDELCAFPNGAHDDQVDAASAAFRGVLAWRPTISYCA